MNSKIQTFKQELNRVFDDNLRTKQWHNFVDYAIIGFIVLSTVEVFLSTYDGIVERYGTWLHAIDYLTTAFFTIAHTSPEAFIFGIKQVCTPNTECYLYCEECSGKIVYGM